MANAALNSLEFSAIVSAILSMFFPAIACVYASIPTLVKLPIDLSAYSALYFVLIPGGINKVITVSNFLVGGLST